VRVASGDRGVAMDRFLSPLGGSELSWPSPSEAWVVSGVSVRAIDVYGNGCSCEGWKRGTLRRGKAGWSLRPEGIGMREESSRDGALWGRDLLRHHGEGHVQVRQAVSSRVESKLYSNVLSKSRSLQCQWGTDH
jgi:hypothetical protein